MVINTSITDIDTISTASKRAGEADRSECTISDTLRNDVAGLFVHPGFLWDDIKELSCDYGHW
ncbi:hypothetical protein WN51_02766 [Melipona quadrifasciata]|uniref:Uncharacterized protein n=1 Tax=Melipona quadrifasciata TaxID=166423 RepID=A0A0M9A8P6_9HYME|nr:hypothetical protein WN51_02766 [Melipona quadrifasciata]